MKTLFLFTAFSVLASLTKVAAQSVDQPEHFAIPVIVRADEKLASTVAIPSGRDFVEIIGLRRQFGIYASIAQHVYLFRCPSNIQRTGFSIESGDRYRDIMRIVCLKEAGQTIPLYLIVISLVEIKSIEIHYLQIKR